MKSLSQEAKGRHCTIRIPGICNGDPATTVGCHINGAGMGMKAHTIHQAWGCSSCHDCVDFRVQTGYSRDEIKLMHLEGVIETQTILLKEGKIK